MRDKLKNEKIAFELACLFLVCYFTQLLDFPNKITILFGIIICLILAIRQRNLKFDLGGGLLALTIFSYFAVVNGIFRCFTMSLPYVGVVIYFVGNYLSCEIANDNANESKSIQLILTMVLGMTLHGILNSYCFLDGQLQNNNVRLWQDFWIDAFIPGTWQVIYFVPVMAMTVPAILYFKERKLLNIFMIASVLFFVYISLASQSRTSIVMFPIVIFIQILLYVILEHKKLVKYLKNKKVQIAVIIFLIIISAAVVIVLNSSVGKNFMAIMGRDGGILNNVRFKYQRHALKQIKLYPLGGEKMDFLGYPHAHNSWLDIADTAGWIPFFSFTAYTVIIVCELIKWLLKKEISTERKLIVTGLFTVFFLFNTIERGFGGSMHYMTPWFFINAMVHGELSMSKNKSKIC